MKVYLVYQDNGLSPEMDDYWIDLMKIYANEDLANKYKDKLQKDEPEYKAWVEESEVCDL